MFYVPAVPSAAAEGWAPSHRWEAGFVLVGPEQQVHWPLGKGQQPNAHLLQSGESPGSHEVAAGRAETSCCVSQVANPTSRASCCCELAGGRGAIEASSIAAKEMDAEAKRTTKQPTTIREDLMGFPSCASTGRELQLDIMLLALSVNAQFLLLAFRTRLVARRP